MAKAKKSLKGLGARYGIKLRKHLAEMLLEFGLAKNATIK